MTSAILVTFLLAATQVAQCSRTLQSAVVTPDPRSQPSWALLDDLKAQDDCIKTPQEFVAAFIARKPRCVDPDLIGRTSNSRPGGTVNDTSINVAFGKPAYFWAGNDALEAWIRIGFPENLGDFTVNKNQNYTSEDFNGLENNSNGIAQLTKVGWPGSYLDITSVYAINVFSRKAIKKLIRGPGANFFPYKANVDALRPTWNNVRHFYIYVFQNIGLKISKGVSKILEEMTLAELTGCVTECSYTLDAFPSAEATTPLTTRSRKPDGSCPDVANATVMAPTSLDVYSPLCTGNNGHTWADKMATMSASVAGGCNPDKALASAIVLRDKLNTADNVMDQALWFRAYLMQSCNGAFNALFSGNGFTYTGFGGLLAGVASEYIISPFDVRKIPDDARASVVFCINGLNGGKPDLDGLNGKCPPPPS